jgi:hypothetical protein
VGEGASECAERKPQGVSLKDFMKRHGGINACAGL